MKRADSLKLGAIFPCLDSRSIEFFGKPAFVQKLLLKLAQLLVEEIVGLVDQTDHRVCSDLRLSLFDIGPISLISPIGPIHQLSHFLRCRMIFRPKTEFPLPQKVLEVEK